MSSPFMAPGVIPSAYPKVQSLQGRLVMLQPTSVKTVPNTLGQAGATKEQMTVNVTVVDGRGPIPVFKNRQPTGQMLEGPDFPGMWIDSEVIVKQLRDALEARGTVLATVNVPNPQAPAGKGNAWGLVDPTPADFQTAQNFLASRTVAAVASPAPAAAPQQSAPAPGFAPQAPQVMAQTYSQAVPAPAAAPQPTGYVPGANPFAQPVQ